MDLTAYNMYRVVTEDCWSQSPFPRDTHHTERGLMWKAGEVVQLVGFPGGSLYFAKPLSLNRAEQLRLDRFVQHLWERQFRELTIEEREDLLGGVRVGQEVERV